MSGDSLASLRERLDAVERRLDEHARREREVGLTDPDPATGERWEAGQVWAHLAEFPAYWLGQIERVVSGRESGQPEPIPFGRVRADPGRVGAIERDRHAPVSELHAPMSAATVEARRLLDSLEADVRSARGVHPTLGEMDVERILERFIVGHLEEHADQLDGLSRPATEPGGRAST